MLRFILLAAVLWGGVRLARRVHTDFVHLEHAYGSARPCRCSRCRRLRREATPIAKVVK